MTDLPPDTSPAEAEALARMAARLEHARPVATPAFRSELGDAVAAEARRRHLRARPDGLWGIVAGLVAAGSALLAVAASQL